VVGAVGDQHPLIRPGSGQLSVETSGTAAGIGSVAVAGVMIGARLDLAFIAMLVGGCAVMAVLAMAVERRIPAHANGVAAEASEPATATDPMPAAVPLVSAEG